VKFIVFLAKDVEEKLFVRHAFTADHGKKVHIDVIF